VKVWKVILAALVIFAAGVVTGSLTVRLKVPTVTTAPPTTNLGPLRPRGELLDRMERQLYLSPAQRGKIEQILRENHDRMKQLWDSIAPQAQEEHRRVNELIRAQLEPAQLQRFEEMLKRSPNREERRRHEERREGKSPRKAEASKGAGASKEPSKVGDR
jgi:hypothetical protein